MIISHKYKFIFIKTGKTAGTSLQQYLYPYLDKEDVIRTGGLYPEQNARGFYIPYPDLLQFMLFPSTGPPNHRRLWRVGMDFHRRLKFYGHLPAFVARQRVPNHIWNNYFKFCVERNPWDKTISHYYFLKNGRRKRHATSFMFDDYMNEENKPLNYPFYTDLRGKIIADRVIYYENLNKELSEVFNHLGIPFEGVLGIKKNTWQRKNKIPYQEFFSGDYEQYINVIRETFKKEIELHGYEF